MKQRYQATALVLLYVVLYAIDYWAHYAQLNVAGILLQEQRNQGPLDTAQAWQHLQFIASAPHPYNSKQIHIVYDYISSIAEGIAGNATRPVEVAYDNVSIYKDDTTYFECANILLKVSGDSKKAVIIDAHADAVPTSFGATDNGISVAASLQVAKALSQQKHLASTVIFNINFGEEDGLLGAKCFTQHPWYKDAVKVINIDGAGTGGREIVFGANDYNMMESYRKTAPYPHANVFGNDFFKLGLVRSKVDFEVYRDTDVTGLSLAFYEPRAFYHTPSDDVLHITPSSLQHLMYNVYGVASSFDVKQPSTTDAFVYFDVLRQFVIVLNAQEYLISNITVLVVGAIVLAVIGLMEGWKVSLGSLLYTGAMVIIPLIASAIVGTFTALINPYVIHNSPTILWIVLLLVQLLAIQVGQHSWQTYRHEKKSEQMTEFDATFGLSVFWWIMLLVLTILSRTSGIGIGYIFLVNEVAVILSLMLVWTNRCVDKLLDDDETGEQATAEEQSPLLGRGHDTVEEDEDTEDDEDIGLIIAPSDHKILRVYRKAGLYRASPIFCLLLLIVPILLSIDVSLVLTASLYQTLTDGTPAFAVYFLISVSILLVILPSLGFLHRIGGQGDGRPILFVPTMLLVVFGLLYISLAFPFSSRNPCKVFYQQEWELDTNKSIVSLRGVEPYTYQMSEQMSDYVSCRDVEGTSNFQECSWPAPVPRIGDQPVSITTTSEGSRYVLNVDANGSAHCRMNVTSLNANSRFSAALEGQKALEFNTTVEIGVYQREVKPWNVGLIWADEVTNMSAKVIVECYYNEWYGSVQQPAWDDALKRKPDWSIMSYRGGGLSKVSTVLFI